MSRRLRHAGEQMRKRTNKPRKRGRLLLWSALAAFPVLALLLYCAVLSGKIEERFSGRRWSMPSTVYSDSMLLFPGRKVHRARFERKLYRLG